ncbi:uncharacterized protein VTP21DRAFT_11214 [Calcarisporiella thermophila]|uniref:uncharacterized protein n=1 Tax=Calcarisporiella thermophila TaxID=911321 RepID=UPI003742E7BF
MARIHVLIHNDLRAKIMQRLPLGKCTLLFTLDTGMKVRLESLIAAVGFNLFGGGVTSLYRLLFLKSLGFKPGVFPDKYWSRMRREDPSWPKALVPTQS